MLIPAVPPQDDPRQYFCWPVYLMAAGFNSTLALSAGRRTFANKFARSLPVVLMVQVVGLVAIWALITIYIFGYSSLPPLFVEEIRIGRVGFNIAEIVFMTACVGVVAWERWWIKPEFVPRTWNQDRAE